MALMGRRRKVDSGLQPRVYLNHGAYYYVHQDGRWERLGTDKEAANARARVFNDPSGRAGTLVHFMDLFLADCAHRVGLKSAVKGVKLAQRTYEDYQDAIGTDDKPGALRVFFALPLTPQDVTPDMVQDFLDAGAEANRATRSNRERAALSACFGWLLRKKHCPGLMVNPCLRASGIQRNPESKRERYVTHEEYLAVWAAAPRAVRLMMELTYRTLQRPESDIILWNRSVVVQEGAARALVFKQNKTGQSMRIAFTLQLDELIPRERVHHLTNSKEPLVRRLDSKHYTYDGLSSMLKRAIEVASERRKARGLPAIPSFGFRDLKGKGATDMWLDGTPVEQIQALLGHKTKTTTEIYIKQRYRESVQPNTVKVG